jgi:DNA-binding winged helix-turn-helix (wHTH) protein
MSREIKRCYQFGRFQVDASRRLLLREGQPVCLPPKAFETLLFRSRTPDGCWKKMS